MGRQHQDQRAAGDRERDADHQRRLCGDGRDALQRQRRGGHTIYRPRRAHPRARQTLDGHQPAGFACAYQRRGGQKRAELPGATLRHARRHGAALRHDRQAPDRLCRTTLHRRGLQRLRTGERRRIHGHAQPGEAQQPHTLLPAEARIHGHIRHTEERLRLPAMLHSQQRRPGDGHPAADTRREDHVLSHLQVEHRRQEGSGQQHRRRGLPRPQRHQLLRLGRRPRHAARRGVCGAPPLRGLSLLVGLRQGHLDGTHEDQQRAPQLRRRQAAGPQHHPGQLAEPHAHGHAPLLAVVVGRQRLHRRLRIPQAVLRLHRRPRMALRPGRPALLLAARQLQQPARDAGGL